MIGFLWTAAILSWCIFQSFLRDRPKQIPQLHRAVSCDCDDVLCGDVFAGRPGCDPQLSHHFFPAYTGAGNSDLEWNCNHPERGIPSCQRSFPGSGSAHRSWRNCDHISLFRVCKQFPVGGCANGKFHPVYTAAGVQRFGRLSQFFHSHVCGLFRLFTDKEEAQNHCNVGNGKIVLDTICAWITQIDEENAATE